jgi:hypothetical protein
MGIRPVAKSSCIVKMWLEKNKLIIEREWYGKFSLSEYGAGSS